MNRVSLDSFDFSPFFHICIYIYLYIPFFRFFFPFFFLFTVFSFHLYIFHIEQYPQSRLVNEQYFRDPEISKKFKGEQRFILCVCVRDVYVCVCEEEREEKRKGEREKEKERVVCRVSVCNTTASIVN